MLPGSKAFISVKPLTLKVEKEALGIEVYRRQCRYLSLTLVVQTKVKQVTFRNKDEKVGDSIFKTYSKANCLLECAINIVVSELECIPWYLNTLQTMQHMKLCSGRKVR